MKLQTESQASPQLPQGGESPLCVGGGGGEEEAVTSGLASLATEVPTLAEPGFKGGRRPH